MIVSKLLLVYIGTAAAAVAAATPFSTQSKETALVANISRGGAGPLDADIVAKANCILQVVSGAFMALAPSKATELYHFPKTPLNEYITEGMGTAASAYALLTTSMVMYGQSLERAAALSAVPYLILNLKRLLNGTSRNPVQEGISAILMGGLLYGGLQSTSWNTDYLKYLMYFTLANGLVGSIAPKLLSQAWGYNNDVVGKDGAMLVRSTMLWTLCRGIVQYCVLEKGKSVSYGMGLSAIPQILQVLALLFITKEPETFNMNKGMLYSWVAIFSVVAVTSSANRFCNNKQT